MINYKNIFFCLVLCLSLIMVSSCAAIIKGMQDLNNNNTALDNSNDNEDNNNNVVPEPEPLTCEENEAGFNDAMAKLDCANASIFLDGIIDGACTAGNPMQLITKVMTYVNSGACTLTCKQRTELALAYGGIGQDMQMANEINWMAAFSACAVQCVELKLYYKGNPMALQPCPALSCTEQATGFSYEMARESCSGSNSFLDAYIVGKCSQDAKFLEMAISLQDAGCTASCSQLDSLFYSYIALGDDASARIHGTRLINACCGTAATVKEVWIGKPGWPTPPAGCK